MLARGHATLFGQISRRPNTRSGEMWPVGYQSEGWICSLNSLNICPILFSWFALSILRMGPVTMVTGGCSRELGGTCRSVCVRCRFRCILWLWGVSWEFSIFRHGYVTEVGEWFLVHWRVLRSASVMAIVPNNIKHITPRMYRHSQVRLTKDLIKSGYIYQYQNISSSQLPPACNYKRV